MTLWNNNHGLWKEGDQVNKCLCICLLAKYLMAQWMFFIETQKVINQCVRLQLFNICCLSIKDGCHSYLNLPKNGYNSKFDRC